MTNKVVKTVGRRKRAVARVRLVEGNGQIMINGKPASEVYRGLVYQKLYQRPFEVTKTLGKYTATVKVFGGGLSSQVEAIMHGLARSLVSVNEEYKLPLRSVGLLTRDPRERERRKYGLARGARAEKQSPKR